jgi:FixJ family two-component response regulator
MDAPKVYVVDDDETFLKVVTSLLTSVRLSVESFSSAKKFLQLFQQQAENITNSCILLDIRMPEISGLDVLEIVKKEPMCPPVIMITAHADVPSAVRAMKAGAFDFIEKPFTGQALIDIIQKGIEADRKKRGKTVENRSLLTRLASLSRREREVLDLVVAGKASKQIADDLNISIHTVDNHRAHIMAKMKTDSVADLVRATVSASLKSN